MILLRSTLRISILSPKNLTIFESIKSNFLALLKNITKCFEHFTCNKPIRNKFNANRQATALSHIS